MGVLVKKQKGYFEDPRKFADLWNALVYEGDEPVEKVADCVMKQTKEDRLRPVSTLVLYWNDREWDGANSLHELIDFKDVEGLKEFVPEFHLHVYDMSKVKHLERFRTDLSTLVGLYQRRGNKEEFREFGRHCEEAGKEKQLDRLGLEVLGELVKSKRLINLINTIKKEEEQSMCKAIENIYEEGLEKGREEGREAALREAARADAAEKELQKMMAWLQEKGISYAVE